MNILIVENEKPAADKLVRLLMEIDNSLTILGVIETVEGTINRLQEKPQPDLILMDIQLDDGLCFEIFETTKIDTPVIFTTAYDEYTLKAFKVNSIDYLLKPIDRSLLKSALAKFKKLYADNDPFKKDFKQLMFEFRNQYKSRFLIKIGEKYKSVPVGPKRGTAGLVLLQSDRHGSHDRRGLYPGRHLLGMAPQRPDCRNSPVGGSEFRHRQLPDVHAGICPARQHSPVAAFHADDVGLHCRTLRVGTHAGRFCHHADDADCWIYAFALQPALDAAFWFAHALVFAIPYDHLRPERGFPYHDHGARLPGGRTVLSVHAD